MMNVFRTTVASIAFALSASFFAATSALGVNSVGDLKQVETQVRALVDKTLPCTVCIVSVGGGGSGSGVTVSEEGLVLTAAHVIPAAGQDLLVIFPDGRKVKAKSLGSNRMRDAGMVQITEPGSYPFVELGESKDLERNDWCISLGHAGGFQSDRTPPVRLGRILVNDRFVVTDCAIIAGDSGGPLFDLDGKVIGIHSNIGESLSQNQHVPVGVFVEDWERMKSGESWGGVQQIDPRKLIIGVRLSPQPNEDGVVLAGVTPNSPAERAGLESGDVVTKIDDEEMKSPADVVAVVKGKKAGDKLQLSVKRADEQIDFEVRLIRAGQLEQRGRRSRGRQRRGAGPEDSGRPQREQKSSSDEKGPTQADELTDEDIIPKTENDSAADVDAKGEIEAGENTGPATDEFRKQTNGRSIEELIRLARQGNGQLELTPTERQRLQKFMIERFRNQRDQVGQVWQPPSIGNDGEWFARLMEVYEPVVAIASDSTYRMLVDGRQVALGTAVSNRTILTKASEIDGLDFEIQLDTGEYVEGQVLRVFKQYDLALIEISDGSVVPIKLSSKDQEMPLGTFLASVDTSNAPLAIGLISVKTREFESERGFLGVMLNKTDDGIVVSNILRQSAAEKAGVEVNDIISKFNEKPYGDVQALIKAVGSYPPDQKVELLVQRGDQEVEISATLGKLPVDPRSRMERMNQMGTELSDMRSGFPLALQHDCPIEANACGGPLVSLDGEVVGINIARAGRIKSYALPASVIQELLVKELAEKPSAK